MFLLIFFFVCLCLFVQVYPRRWLQAAQLLADLLQNHQQLSSAPAHLAHTTEAAPQSGPPQTGRFSQPQKTLRHTSELIFTPAHIFSIQPEQYSKVGEATEQDCRH